MSLPTRRTTTIRRWAISSTLASGGCPEGAPALVAVPGAVVGEAVARSGDEVPDIAVGTEGQLQDAVCVGHGLSIGRDGRRHARRIATRAHVELADPARRIRIRAGVLRGEALVVVLLTVEHDLRTRGIEIVPDRQHPRGAVPARIV